MKITVAIVCYPKIGMVDVFIFVHHVLKHRKERKKNRSLFDLFVFFSASSYFHPVFSDIMYGPGWINILSILNV